MSASRPVARLAIDMDRCQGHGRCYSLVPALFSPDDDGAPILETSDLSDGDLDQARLAARACPESAITMEDL